MVSRNNKSNKSSLYLSEPHVLWISFFFLFFSYTSTPLPSRDSGVYLHAFARDRKEKNTAVAYVLFAATSAVADLQRNTCEVACISKHRTYAKQLHNYSSIQSLTNSPSMQVIPPDMRLTQWSVRESHFSCCSYKTPFFQHATAIHFYFVSGLHCSAEINRDLFSFEFFSWNVL